MDKVNQKMKKFNLRGVLDGFRSSVSTPPKSELDIEENLRSEHFQVAKVELSNPIFDTCRNKIPISSTFHILGPSYYVISFIIYLFQTVRHGFPFQPTAMAYDPVQNLLAIGSNTGSLRMYPCAEISIFGCCVLKCV